MRLTFHPGGRRTTQGLFASPLRRTSAPNDGGVCSAKASCTLTLTLGRGRAKGLADGGLPRLASAWLLFQPLCSWLIAATGENESGAA